MLHFKTLSGASASLLLVLVVCVSLFAGVGVVAGQPVDMFMVTYDANGGVEGGVPVDVFSPYESGAVVSVVGNPGGLSREGFVFLGWAFSASASLPNFAVSDSSVYPASFVIGSSGDVVLYAVWGEGDSSLSSIVSVGVSDSGLMVVFVLFAVLVLIVWVVAVWQGVFWLYMLSAGLWFALGFAINIFGLGGNGLVTGVSMVCFLFGCIMSLLGFVALYGMVAGRSKGREESVF